MNGTVKEAKLGFAELFLRYFAYALVHLVQRPLVVGKKPFLDRPTIFVCRHVGLMDPVILMVLYFKKMVRPLIAKDYYQKNAFTRKFYPIAQCIPLDRYNPSKQWLEDSMTALGKAESVIIYPEGKRNKNASGLLPFHNGAALLAGLSGAQIIPVYNARWKFPHRYRLAIGKPFVLDPMDTDESAWLKTQTVKIQKAVAELAPLVEPSE